MYAAGGHARRALGAIDDPFSEDFGDDGSADPRDAYVAWAAAVKQYGGTVAAAPSSSNQIAVGDAAARYPVAVITPAPSYNLNPIFHAWPDLWTSSGAYGWYKAPAAVLAYTAGSPRSFWDVGTWFGSSAPAITQPNASPGEPPIGNPTWYDQLTGALKVGAWAIGGLVVLAGLSYLPRPRRD